MNLDSYTVANVQIYANPDGSFTISDPTVAVAIATLTGPQILEACGWIIGKAAKRALEAHESRLARWGTLGISVLMAEAKMLQRHPDNAYILTHLERVLGDRLIGASSHGSRADV